MTEEVGGSGGGGCGGGGGGDDGADGWQPFSAVAAVLRPSQAKLDLHPDPFHTSPLVRAARGGGRVRCATPDVPMLSRHIVHHNGVWRGRAEGMGVDL
jgi:hypothetical protein